MLRVMSKLIKATALVVISAIATSAIWGYIHLREKTESLKVSLAGNMIILKSLEERDLPRAAQNLVVAITGQYNSLQSLGFDFSGPESTNLLQDAERLVSEQKGNR